MKRITRHACDDVPIPEEQETEGQRQLHNLLLQQLDTDVNIDRCVAKKKCFAPAAVYKPFGEQAAGVRSLSQFQYLQDGDQELAALRELGLTDAEIELWRCRDQTESSWKAIRDKMAAHAELLSRPQRFSNSRPLFRREIEIKKALFQGSDRCSFLTALYHREEESPVSQQGATSTSAMDHFYKVFLEDHKKMLLIFQSVYLRLPKIVTDIQCKSPSPKSDQSQTHTVHDSSPNKDQHICTEPSPVSDTVNQPQSQEKSVIPIKGTLLSQSIGTLSAASAQGYGGPVTVNIRIHFSLAFVCVKNMSPRASLAQLVSLFSRFRKDDTQPILYRLLTGRLKGQAFITFSDIRSAQAALDLINGYKLLGKPLIIEFGRERSKETDAQTDGPSVDPNTPSSCNEKPA
uniref:RNA binding motif protein 41 n=1 Tax=Sinocyclocheilus anshuiensis TaxID=1608454 RepID=A0A671QFD3_9TELE